MIWWCVQCVGSLIQHDIISRQRKFGYCKSRFYCIDCADNNTFRCIDHSMHHAAYHFIKELGVSSTRRGKHEAKPLVNKEDDTVLTEIESDDVESDHSDNNAEIDTSMDIEASGDDVEAMKATTIVDFDLGDTLGKFLAFINQVHMSSEGVREFLGQICGMHGIKPIELCLCVHTCWGSLSDCCLKSALEIQKVQVSFLMLIVLY